MAYSQHCQRFTLFCSFRLSARIFMGVMAVIVLYGCTSPNQSTLLYRLPYADGTDMCVGRDHLTHTPNQNRFDLGGVNSPDKYRVVAAATGIVRIIVDNNTQNCCGNSSCGNNYVWLEHIGLEWSKYSHLETGSVRGDAALTEGDVVVAGTFLGYQSNVGRACSRCGSQSHLHFEVGVPNDPNNPLTSAPGTPNSGGFLNGSNRIARFCSVQNQTLVAGRNETAARCDLLLSCLQSKESPSTEGQCEAGLGGDICVQEINNVEDTSTYTRGIDFNSSSVKIDLDWCPNGTCDSDVNVGRAIQVVVIPEDGNVDPIEFLANCQNRKVIQTVHGVQQIIVQKLPGNLEDDNTVCGGNSVPDAFGKWEICDIPSVLSP